MAKLGKLADKTQVKVCASMIPFFVLLSKLEEGHGNLVMLWRHIASQSMQIQLTGGGFLS